MVAIRPSLDTEFQVGCVPYVNGRPLVWAFEQPGNELPVGVAYDVPSKLPAMLDSGQADAVLASSIEALATSGRRIVAGIAIASHGPVESVRLFSKVPFGAIRRLALDQSSMTSNALASILLKEVYKVEPEQHPEPPHLGNMLRENDACILIGDIGMRADGRGLHVLDLGEAWTRHTRLPFVWALWIGGRRLTPELAGHLMAARTFSALGAGAFDRSFPKLHFPHEFDSPIKARREKQIQSIAEVSGWMPSEVRRYLTKIIGFDLTERHIEGLRLFQQKLQTHGWTANETFPETVVPEYGLTGPGAFAGTQWQS